MSDNPWIEWGGGDCPVAPDVMVEVRLRTGDEIGASGTLSAGDWMVQPEYPDDPSNWEHHGHPDDIIAYRVVKP